MIRPIIGLLLALAIASCGDSSGGAQLTQADSGDEILVDTGDRFEVRLEANLSTGYSWEVDPGSATAFLTMVSSTYEAPDSDLVGAAGTEIFVFEAAQSGAGILRLNYIRPFDDPVIPERVVEFIVRADGVPWTRDSGQPPDTSTATAPSDGSGDVISVTALFDGEGPRDATVSGFVLSDGASVRLCEVLMESFPPQCGGLWIVIANPEGVDVELQQEAEGVRWTDNAVAVEGRFDGQRFVLTEGAASVEPSDDDRDLAAAFLAHARSPSLETGAALPFAEETALGLGDRILKTLTRDDLADPTPWILDAEDYEGFAGPFSPLDVAAESVGTNLTVGAHTRCAAPPVPAPRGFEELRRVSIQPETAASCVEWWTIDFFVDHEGVVQAVTLDLYGP